MLRRGLYLVLVSMFLLVGPARAAVVEHVGWVSCSMGNGTQAGWYAINPETWPRYDEQSGKTLQMWSTEGGKNGDPVGVEWEGFDRMHSTRPQTDVIVVMVCVNKQKQSATFAEAQLVYNLIQGRVPGAHVIWMGQPSYEAGHVCVIAGADGPARAATVADQAVAAGLGERGPTLTLLNSQLSDTCHPNAAGQMALGQQMQTWWTSR